MMKKWSLLFGLTLVLFGFAIPKNMQSKVEKELKQTLNITSFKLYPINISSEINIKIPLKITSNSFFNIEEGNKIKGYLYYGQAKGKSAKFDYIVIFDKNLIIAKIKLMAYRESYGGEIGSVRWLKQFIGLTPKSPVIYKKDIAGISGATISATSLTREVNKLLQSISILKENQIL